MTRGSTQHVPVMASEVITWLRPAAGQTLVDGTLGGGGHARLLAEAVGSSGRLIALDRDLVAVEAATSVLRDLPVRVCHANYSDLPEVLAQLGIAAVDGILLDLGLSSDQLADADRGFSFHSIGPLDLRFDMSHGEPAWKLVERLSAEHLADLIYQYGEERFSRQIARRIVELRRKDPIRTSADLAAIVRQAVPRSRDERIDPATRTFQALRIAVNEELKWLEVALRRLPGCLNPDGRLAVISFHSLEDRRVKEAFRNDDRLEVLTRRPVRPGEQEIADNPRSRSAKLRVAAQALIDRSRSPQGGGTSMSDERNLGVTEVRLGLTILTCLLVALGYYVLQRLGDSPESSPIVISPARTQESYQASSNHPAGNYVQPQILPIQGSEPATVPYPRTALRPLWLAPQPGTNDVRRQRFDTDESAGNVGEQSLFNSPASESRDRINERTRY